MSPKGTKRGLLERLDAGEVIIGDGAYIKTLEQRCYVLPVHWTPEVVCEYPEAVLQLGTEFCRAGADITQTCTYYSSGTNLSQDDTGDIKKERTYTCAEINKKACELSRELANKWDTMVGGSVSQTEAYGFTGKNKADKAEKKKAVRAELSNAIQVLIDNNVDFLIVEYFGNIEEMEWAIELAREYGKPVAANMCIGPKGDRVKVPTIECARRMIKAGADIIGLNCLFDPIMCLDAMKDFKAAVDELPPGVKKPHLMAQPNGYFTQDCGRAGWLHTDGFPFAMEPRHMTRWDAAKYARQAYDMGIRYIGGCCGFEAYHIRAMAEELTMERGGKLPDASRQSDIGLKLNRQRAEDMGLRTDKWTPDFWNKMYPIDGRLPPEMNGHNGNGIGSFQK